MRKKHQSNTLGPDSDGQSLLPVRRSAQQKQMRGADSSDLRPTGSKLTPSQLSLSLLSPLQFLPPCCLSV